MFLSLGSRRKWGKVTSDRTLMSDHNLCCVEETARRISAKKIHLNSDAILKEALCG